MLIKHCGICPLSFIVYCSDWNESVYCMIIVWTITVVRQRICRKFCQKADQYLLRDPCKVFKCLHRFRHNQAKPVQLKSKCSFRPPITLHTVPYWNIRDSTHPLNIDLIWNANKSVILDEKKSLINHLQSPSFKLPLSLLNSIFLRLLVSISHYLYIFPSQGLSLSSF